ncbi:MAG TPA: type I pantothenate kinase [Thermoanaerobaculia bacterium]|nr:type I pantothenate kinase [Thermoanaerobaculia bacterium]
MDDLRSRYLVFTREQWARLRGGTPLTLSEQDVAELSGIEEKLSLREVEEVYLPLSRLMNLHIAAVGDLHRVTSRFLGALAPRVPYLIALAGSVSAGKSTTARILRTLLSRWPDHPRVHLVTTDGFLFPNRVLEQRGLMERKGFPESYDLPSLIRFVSDLKSGRFPLRTPVYSHFHYDILEGEELVVDAADIVILEGLNVLQSGLAHTVFVSDYVDFSIYVDAPEDHLRAWYLDRFRKLRETAFQDPASFFHDFARMTAEEAESIATGVWTSVNLANLRENIAPTREKATLILEKGAGHAIERVLLRRL